MTEEAQAERTRRFPCRGCGADVEYVPRVGMKCTACGTAGGMPQNEDKLIEESSYEEYLRNPRGPRGYGATGTREVNCKQCGAGTRIAGDAASVRCAFCGSGIVVEDAPDDGVVRPEAVAPFQITRQQAYDRFNAWVAGLWFAPTELKRLKEPDRIAGVYRPYWTWDAATQSWYAGERGEHYYVTETYTDTEYVNGQARTVTKTRQVQHTRWYPASGQVAEFFDDILLFAGRPTGWDTRYNLDELCPYDPGFLAGWQAEKYTIPPERAWPSAKEIIDRGIHQSVCRDIGGDEQRVHSIRTSYDAIRFKHLLLPLFLASYFYSGKTYRFQVNGQTGEVNGERPYSFWKIVLLVAAVLAVVAVAAAIFAAAQRS